MDDVKQVTTINLSSAKKKVLASLALTILSATIFYVFTCSQMVSVAGTINPFGPMTDSKNLKVALGASALMVTSGSLLVYSIVPRLGRARDAKPYKLLLLGLSNLLVSALAIFAAWFIYADSVFCRGCETGSCLSLVFFRCLKLWAAGAIGAGSVLLITKAIRR